MLLGAEAETKVQTYLPIGDISQAKQWVWRCSCRL